MSGQYLASKSYFAPLILRIKLVSVGYSANLLKTVWYCHRYESCIDVEIQQRAIEYFALSRKGAALMDILAEMPKFPERQVYAFTNNNRSK